MDKNGHKMGKKALIVKNPRNDTKKTYINVVLNFQVIWSRFDVKKPRPQMRAKKGPFCSQLWDSIKIEFFFSLIISNYGCLTTCKKSEQNINYCRSLFKRGGGHLKRNLSQNGKISHMKMSEFVFKVAPSLLNVKKCKKNFFQVY